MRGRLGRGTSRGTPRTLGAGQGRRRQIRRSEDRGISWDFQVSAPFPEERARMLGSNGQLAIGKPALACVECGKCYLI